MYIKKLKQSPWKQLKSSWPYRVILVLLSSIHPLWTKKKDFKTCFLWESVETSSLFWFVEQQNLRAPPSPAAGINVQGRGEGGLFLWNSSRSVSLLVFLPHLYLHLTSLKSGQNPDVRLLYFWILWQRSELSPNVHIFKDSFREKFLFCCFSSPFDQSSLPNLSELKLLKTVFPVKWLPLRLISEFLPRRISKKEDWGKQELCTPQR